MKAFLRHIFTDGSNQSFELLRVCGGLGVLAYILYAGIALMWKGQPWNPLEYGAGLAALVGGIGGGVGIKERMERPGPNTTTVTATSTVQEPTA